MRRIGIFTATRAEYGLLRPVARAMAASALLEPLLVVSGAHLSAAHGGTIGEIEADGLEIAARVPAPVEGDAPLDAARALAGTVTGVAEAFVALDLDAVMILGDRSEALGAASAAAVLGLPILHLEGGHLTGGAIDDAIRHAISKLAALHFTAHEDYRRRLLQMGEAEDRVFVVGPTGAESLGDAMGATLEQASIHAGFDVAPRFLLATWHPETLTPEAGGERLAALDARTGHKVLITLPNADAGGASARETIAAWAAARPDRVAARASLGRDGYVAAMAAADAVVGNSSSGVIEAPLIGTPTVNIGDRQAGRRRAASVVDCACDAGAIGAALDRALAPGFRAAARAAARNDDGPTTDGRAGERIVAILEATDLTGLQRKPFVDRPIV